MRLSSVECDSTERTDQGASSRTKIRTVTVPAFMSRDPVLFFARRNLVPESELDERE